ncbi:RNA polymerase-binding protein DksA [Enterobacteriaceae endosymbiont of Macroplea appendiculata]|uniref:RNA polymerase-binding protein DksA n=1 Tax=Enterobacteriaceae endosymbiont of Macroplea appendiculata TaxID=2675790 RepID=UPI0014497B89|nr:RNA polymerase-binding protein DksA [Enterobacteriaceae endosymbiont of Macroplea appendiculata]QJC30855.1 RNA polymerase-binding protein DksA [Enterobacteriaceae endosymbiont of Macroplea appendiculata]
MNKKCTLSSLNILSIAGVQPYQLQPHEKYMNHKQLLHFKQILQAWCNKLKSNKKLTIRYIKNKTSNYPDLIDRAVQEEELNLTLRNQEREQTLIKQIEHTLSKLNTNNFGYCDICAVEIGIKRLEARPTANLCIDCKTLSEIREKQMIE